MNTVRERSWKRSSDNSDAAVILRTRGGVQRVILAKVRSLSVPSFLGSLGLLVALSAASGFCAVAGSAASGVVLDEQGRPVRGVVVLDESAVSSTAASFRRPGTGVLGITDAQGRWSLTNAPGRLLFVHPGFIRETAASTTDAVLLRTGTPVRGIVLDSRGYGIEGVRILGGDFPVWTPLGGRFELRNCRPGQLLLVAEAPGCAASWKEMTVQESATEFRWVVPLAQRRQLRVVDSSGHAVADAEVTVEKWGAPIPWDWLWHTDVRGVVTWEGAPTGEVRCLVMKTGFRPQHNVMLPRAGTDSPVTLRHERTIRGLVHDESGQPLETFSVATLERGIEGSTWRPERPMSGTSRGEFILPLPGDAPVLVRVSSAGFEGKVSGTLEVDEEERTVEFSLRKLDQIIAVVCDQNDHPVVGAEVVWASPGVPAVLGKGSFAKDVDTAPVLTDQAGQFKLGIPRQASAIFAASSATGFGSAPLSTARETRKLLLQPWGRVEGQVVLGGAPQARRLVALNSFGITNLVPLVTAFSAVTDGGGSFSFQHVPPGLCQVGQVVRRRLSHATQLEVLPGHRAALRLGGAGTRVIGRLRVPESNPIWEDTSAPVGLRARDKVAGFAAFYQFEFDNAEAFHVESVPPGNYELEAHWHEIEAATSREVCHGAWRTNVVVPDQAELDLGTLTWQGPAKNASSPQANPPDPPTHTH